MERLWSPWRLAYVTATESATGCIFCDATGDNPDPDRAALVLIRGRHSYVILNLYPYNSGHLMVAPYQHGGGSFEQQTDTQSSARPHNPLRTGFIRM